MCLPDGNGEMEMAVMPYRCFGFCMVSFKICNCADSSADYCLYYDEACLSPGCPAEKSEEKPALQSLPDDCFFRLFNDNRRFFYGSGYGGCQADTASFGKYG